MADRRRIHLPLIGAGQISRRHPDEIKPPGLVLARNVYLSRSDSLLTLRPDWGLYSDTEHTSQAQNWARPAGDVAGDFLSHAEYSVRSGYALYWSRMFPYSWGSAGVSILADTYTDGAISTDGTSLVVTGDDSTRWVQYVWAGCYLLVSGTYYLITSVTSDNTLTTETAVPELDASSYTIVRTHHPDSALYPMHISRYTTQLIYTSPVLQAALPERRIAGPWYVPFDAVDGALWSEDQQVAADFEMDVTAIAASVHRTQVDPLKVLCGSAGRVVASALAFWHQRPSLEVGGSSGTRGNVPQGWSSYPPGADSISGAAWGTTSMSDGLTEVLITVSPTGWLHGDKTDGPGAIANDGQAGGYWMMMSTGNTGNTDTMKPLVSSDPASAGSWALGAAASADTADQAIDLKYAGGKWYAAILDDSGTVLIAVSDDNGTSWGTTYTKNDGGSAFSSGDSDGPHIATNGAIWVCCLRTDYVYYTNDMTFTTMNQGTPVSGAFDVNGSQSDKVMVCEYLNGRFWMGGVDVTAPFLHSSEDGQTWTAATLPGTLCNTVNAIAYHSGILVVVASGTGDGLAYSEDNGATWTAVTMTGDTWNGVVWNGNRWIAVGDGVFATSDDGKTWTETTNALSHNSILYSEADNLLLTTKAGTAGDIYLWSDGGPALVVCDPAGKIYSNRTTSVDSGRRVRSMGQWFVNEPNAGRLATVRNLNLSVAEFGLVDSDGNFLYGDGWGGWAVQATGSSVGLRDCATDGTNVVVVGESDDPATGDAEIYSAAASDLTTWTPQTSGVNKGLRRVVYCHGLGLWVAAGEDGTVLTSPDFTTWTSRTSGVTADIAGLATNRRGNVVIACTVAQDESTAPDVIYSPDGVTWTTHTWTADHETDITGVDLNCVEWDDRQRCFMVGTSATQVFGFQPHVYYDTWTADQSIGVSAGQKAFALEWESSSGLFAVCGEFGVYEVDPGTSSSARYTSAPIYDVATDGSGLWVGVGKDGTMVYKSGGLGGAWSAVSATPQTNTLWAVIWDGTNFLAFGDAGVILESNGTTVTTDADWSAVTSGTGARLRCATYAARSADGAGVDRIFVGGSGGTLLRSPTGTYAFTADTAADWADDFGTTFSSDKAPEATITAIAASEDGHVVLAHDKRFLWTADNEYRGFNLSFYDMPIGGIGYSADADEWLAVVCTSAQSRFAFEAVSRDGVTWSGLRNLEWTVVGSFSASPVRAGQATASFAALPVAWDGSNWWVVSNGNDTGNPQLYYLSGQTITAGEETELT